MIGRLWRRAAPWATPAVVILEVALVWSGRISLGTAIGVVVVVEIVLLVTVADRAFAARRAFGQARGAGGDRWRAVEVALAEMLPRPLAKMILVELRLFGCLLGWPRAHRRRNAVPDGQEFRYDASLRPILWMAFGLVILEGAVLDLVLAAALPGSIWVWVVLGLHVYGAIWLLGMLASLATRPHLLTDHALILRDSILAEVVIEYDAILGAAVSRHSNFGRSGFTVDDAEQTALLAYGDATVALTLDPAVPVYVGDGDAIALRTLRLTADEPSELLHALEARGVPRACVRT